MGREARDIVITVMPVVLRMNVKFVYIDKEAAGGVSYLLRAERYFGAAE